jgi:hypothetical protein
MEILNRLFHSAVARLDIKDDRPSYFLSLGEGKSCEVKIEDGWETKPSILSLFIFEIEHINLKKKNAISQDRSSSQMTKQLLSF